MGSKNIFIINAVLFVLIMFSISVVYQHQTGQQLVTLPVRLTDSVAVEAHNGNCSEQSAIDINSSNNPYLLQLKKYQAVCSSFLTDQLMIFTDMPISKPAAQATAKTLASSLKEFADNGVSPVVVAEPDGQWGPVDFAEFDSGFYDDWLADFFTFLREEGVDDSSIGTWIPFPEANLPYWNNNEPQYFGPNVNRYVRILKAEFPSAKAGILLNSATYETDDFDWRSGDYSSLLPYVANLDSTLIDLVGIQGLPWVPPSDSQTGAILNGAEFINRKLILEVVETTGINHVWINTGTFASKYTLDPDKQVSLEATRRKDILSTIINEARELKNQPGLTVSVNLFVQDKSGQAEATNWSYLRNTPGTDASHESIFVDAIQKLNDADVEVWLFDA